MRHGTKQKFKTTKLSWKTQGTKSNARSKTFETHPINLSWNSLLLGEREKISIYNKDTKQAEYFIYIGYYVTYKNIKTFPKTSKLQHIIGVIHKVFRPSLVLKHTRIRVLQDFSANSIFLRQGS